MKTTIRLWPALLMIVMAAALIATTPFLFPRTMVHFFGVLMGLVLPTFGILLWWVAFSRVRGVYRWWPVVAFVGYAAFFYTIVYSGDKDVMKVVLFHAPFVILLWVLWLTVSRRAALSTQLRGLMAVILGGWTVSSLVRIDQMSAEMVPELRWAWVPQREELFERERASRHAAKPQVSDAVTIGEGDWPEFRGPARDGKAPGKIRTDWAANPPKQLWRQRVGPGRGSFAVVGDRIFTQEQRGNDETVVCYHAPTGIELWEARVPGRFFEGIAGEGPRATPTIHDGKMLRLHCHGQSRGIESGLRAATLAPRRLRRRCRRERSAMGFRQFPARH